MSAKGLIRSIHSTPTSPVQMPGVNGAEMAIMVGREHGAPNFSLRHFRVQPGGNTPRHSHDYEHEVFIVEGGGTVLLDGSEKTVKAGDVVFIPPNHEHQFKADGAAGLRFLCLVPVTRDCGDPTPGS
ncbi:MAG: cupin domain-containing protein [Phycisphaerales bacterium]|nr:cupin domain-containing protein [Planctomycetota bacterium]